MGSRSFSCILSSPPLPFPPVLACPTPSQSLVPANSTSGSDSAPHLLSAKRGEKVPAGVFTQPCVTQYVLLALEEAIERGLVSPDDITQEKLENFLSRFGRRFYKLPETGNRIVLERLGEKIPVSIKSQDGITEVALSRGGDGDVFSLSWKSA